LSFALYFFSKSFTSLAGINQLRILAFILLASNPLLDLVGLLLGESWFLFAFANTQIMFLLLFDQDGLF
jgi:hypothetical protein